MASRPGRGRRARADARAERAARDGRPARPRRPSRRARRTSPAPTSVDRVDEEALADGRIWPQSRGSQLAGLAVGSRDGERMLDLCAAPGGKATMLRGRGRRGRAARGAGARARGERCARLGARRTSASSTPTRRELPPDLTGFDRALVDAPCSGLGVLAAPARPPLARAAAAGAPARAAPAAAAARPARRDGRLLRLHDQRRRERGRRRRDRPRGRADLGAEWPQFAHPRGRSSC